jgi:hypothetical protein
MWRTRMVSGPYKNANDVSANSPGDWQRIYSNAEAFRTNPSAYMWKGPVDFEPAGTTYNGKSIAGAVQKALSVNNEPTGNYLGFHFRDAAFVYMVDSKNANRNAYRTAVKNALLTLASNPNLDFSNQAKWPVTYYRDINPLFEIINYFTKAYLAYDYIDIGDKETGVATFTDTERAKLDKWFMNAALFASNEHEWDINRLFTNRATSSDEVDYTLARSYTPTTRDGKTLVTHYTRTGPGNTVYGIQQSFNNRRMCSYRFACMVGIKQKNSTLVTNAKKYVKDWIKYSMFPDGTVGEFERWRSTLPDLGWGYTTDVVASAVTIADVLARTGDQSLFEYKTRIGKYNTVSPSKDKSIYSALKVMADIAAKKVEWYGTNDPSKVGNNDYRIDGYVRGGVFSGQSEWKALHDVWLTEANLYYKDATIKAMYMRNGSGMTAYPTSPTSQGKYVVWTGDWGIFPGLLFMFGQTEGNPKPYPGSASIVTPVNQTPVVSAGSDKTITLPQNSLTINGSASDNDGSIASYAWTQVTGATATMSATTTINLSLSNLLAGTYTFRLTVKDDKGATAYDDVTVVVNAASVTTTPATPDTTTTTTQPVSFYRAINVNGSALTIDGNSWEAGNNSNFSLTGRGFSLQTATLTPSTDASRATMIRSSIWRNSGTTYVDATVKSVPAGSYDVYVYTWEDNSSTDFEMFLENTSAGKYSSGSAGSWKKLYLGRKNITDGDIYIKAVGGDAAISGIEIYKVTSTTTNITPLVSAGADKTITLPENALTINGSASDNDGSIASYAWTQVSGAAASMAGTTTINLSLSNLLAGTYTFRLTVKDDKGATASDDVTVVVNPTATATTQPISFYRAINVNGSALTIDGNSWEAGNTSNFSFTGRGFSLQTAGLTPSTDASRATMIRSSIWRNSGTTYVDATVKGVPAGYYDVYIYTWEDNYSTAFEMFLENTSAGKYSSGSAGSWKKLYLGRKNITDGDIYIKAVGGDAVISGIEIFKVNSTTRLAGEEMIFESEYAAYPNPFDSQITVDLTPKERNSETIQLVVRDYAGIEMSSNNLETQNQNSITIDNLNSLKTGNYILEIKTDFSKRLIRIIKQ